MIYRLTQKSDNIGGYDKKKTKLCILNIITAIKLITFWAHTSLPNALKNYVDILSGIKTKKLHIRVIPPTRQNEKKEKTNPLTKKNRS